MRHFAVHALFPAALILAACSDGAKPALPETGSETGPELGVSLTGNWKSVDDANYVLKFNSETYREFYEKEEVSRDQWQPVKSCVDPQPVEKTAQDFTGFQIWTKETDARICYGISNWTADKVSLTYAGTTSSYTRVN